MLTIATMDHWAGADWMITLITLHLVLTHPSSKMSEMWGKRPIQEEASRVRAWNPIPIPNVKRFQTSIKPAGDAARSVDTGVVAATVLHDALVDVLAFKRVFVQSGEVEFFLKFKIEIFFQPPSLLAGTFKRARQICAGTWFFLEIVKYYWSTVRKITS